MRLAPINQEMALNYPAERVLGMPRGYVRFERPALGNQHDLRQLLRRFLREQAPMNRVRESFGSPSGYDRELWVRLTTELGLAALTLPEEVGGDGLGPVEMSIVMHEFGRALAPPWPSPKASACRGSGTSGPPPEPRGMT